MHIHQSTNPSIRSSTTPLLPQNKIRGRLVGLTDPALLQQIGHVRLPMFLRSFAEDLRAAGISLPQAPDPDEPGIPNPPSDSAQVSYFNAIADILSKSFEHLPDGLRSTLLAIENAAQDNERLDEIFRRRLPCLSVSPCPLDRALDLWFSCPDELDQFRPAVGCRVSAVEESSAGIENLASSTRNPASIIELPAIQQSIDPSIPESPTPALHLSTIENPRIHPSTIPSSGSSTVPRPAIENPPIQQSINPSAISDASTILDQLASLLTRFVILPKWAAETLALWILHTYAFHLRDITTYIGLESPEKRCGKTTLLTVLAEVVNRPIVAANISPSAFFRVIEEMRPTLLIDECDTFVRGNDELRGILNAGYKQKTAFVVRVANEARVLTGKDQAVDLRSSSSDLPSPISDLPSAIIHPPSPISDLPASSSDLPSSTLPPNSALRIPHSALRHYSTWCPKILATIGHLPDTLADRCIILRMERKTSTEQCQRLRDLDALPIRNQCLQFVADNADAIAAARPESAAGLNDRAADIWEPLFVLADLAGGHWPQTARQAALALAARASDSNPISSLLLDIAVAFVLAQQDRMFSRDLVESLNARSADRPWFERRNGKPITELWLAQQLRPYGIRPRNLCIADDQAKGYLKDDFLDTFHRYIPKPEARAYLAELAQPTREEVRKPEADGVDPRRQSSNAPVNESTHP